MLLAKNVSTRESPLEKLTVGMMSKYFIYGTIFTALCGCQKESELTPDAHKAKEPVYALMPSLERELAYCKNREDLYWIGNCSSYSTGISLTGTIALVSDETGTPKTSTNYFGSDKTPITTFHYKFLVNLERNGMSGSSPNTIVTFNVLTFEKALNRLSRLGVGSINDGESVRINGDIYFHNELGRVLVTSRFAIPSTQS
jgi:hypothetical protein